MFVCCCFRGYFDDCSQYNCWLKDSNSFETLQEFHGLLSEKDIHVIIAIHALHSGSLLTGTLSFLLGFVLFSVTAIKTRNIYGTNLGELYVKGRGDSLTGSYLICSLIINKTDPHIT